jgi:hypothetical protein
MECRKNPSVRVLLVNLREIFVSVQSGKNSVKESNFISVQNAVNFGRSCSLVERPPGRQLHNLIEGDERGQKETKYSS